MCGIAGWFCATGEPERGTLRAMGDTLRHRGPDGEGIWVDGPCGMAHRRLSIVDLEGGAQPMVSADRRVAVCFNGEIYNHRELRRELELRGHLFRTSSDTESLLHGYREWGEDLPRRLNAMFAFSVWDAETGTALLARDRMGEKPLYYAHLGDGSLLFGSEIKALLAHPGVSRKADPVGIALYLTHEYVPWPHTAFAAIRKLAPGDYLVWKKDGTLRTGTYATLPFGEPTAPRPAREWIAETREALARAVERRLMSDVPLGVFLSGGLDSSAVTAMMCRKVPPREVRTFSIAFEEATFDESSWAQKVANFLGTTHRVRTFSAATMLDVLPRVLDLMDEPFADASLLPTHLLSFFTREHVKVALGGDAGDELFCGYETFRADTAARAWRHLPSGIRGAVARAVQSLPVRTGNFSLDFVAKSFLRGADAVPEFRHTRWLSSFLPHSADDPLLPAVRDGIGDGLVFGVMAKPYMECGDTDHLQRLSHAYIRTYLAEDILTKVDRASMATGLEARAVFIDPEFVSLAARMPSHLKLRGGVIAKYALKKAMEGILPREVIHRKKKGFGIPVAEWLKGPLEPRMRKLLDPGRIADGGMLDASVVSRLVAEHAAGRRDNRKQLWTLMMLEHWRERWDVRV